MASSNTISPKIIVILAIPVILLIALVTALYFIPQPIPGVMDLKVQKLDGSTLETTSLKGNILVVEFMATWCTNCEEISANIANVLTNNSLSNVIFLSVSIDPTHDTNTTIVNWIYENNFQKYALNNSQWFFTRDMSEQYTYYGVSTVPHSFLVNKDSKIVDQHLGYLSYDKIFSWVTNTTLQSSSQTSATSSTGLIIQTISMGMMVTKTV